ncbi:MAG: hypothetical protein K0R31_1249 [Clostridiales bacterium]|nr:hypothetical protein [Clostridiales bacterium]
MNWRIEVLQTSALPLGYGAELFIASLPIDELAILERVTRFELATFTLAR